jgi:crotonobetainyl-CoA:carnitine CoA-transferase CaiB-like acyl-CoA transferase
MKKDVNELLAGICILDLADEQGSFCSKLLADLGATVIKIENPAGDPSRTSKLFDYHNLNKLGITLDLQDPEGKRLFHTLIRNADALVESFSPGQLEALHLGYKQLRWINPRLIHLSITGFGQTGRKRAYHSCDSVQAAFGGQMHVSGIPTGKPLKFFGPQSCYAASLFGANAVLLSLRQRNVTGRGRHIDLSIQEAVASTLDHVMIDYFQNKMTRGRPADDLQIESFFTFPCKDGHIEIPLLHNGDTLLELVNSATNATKKLGAEWKDSAYRKKHYRQFQTAVTGWTARHTKQELFHLGQAMGFPWAPVESPEEVLRSPQLRARRFFARTKPAGKRCSLSVPGLPYKFSAFSPLPPKPAPSTGEHNRQVLKMNFSQANTPSRHRTDDARASSACCGEILRGIRVLDFTRMLSGPYATRILGDFGAEVIKVQSQRTASGAERNDTPYFSAWNRNKRSISLDLNHPEAKEILLELVSVSDVVVENFSPRVLANWGLTYPRLKAVKPDLIMASISAMGQTGPWKNFVGYAPTFHALSGLTYATSRSLDRPVGIGFAYGDVVAGLYAALAILSCIEYRDRTGKGQHIDLSAYEALCTLLGPALFETFSRGNRRLGDSGALAPWGCYPCAGADRWCVIALRSEQDWQRLCRISNRTELKRAGFSAWTGRRRDRATLDCQIAQWTTGLAAEVLAKRLQRSGIAAGVVQNAEDLAKDPQLSARRFFIHLKHPKFGTRFADRSALWPQNEKHECWRAAPELGEDNHYVFVEMLGRSEPEFQALFKKGILEQGGNKKKRSSR